MQAPLLPVFLARRVLLAALAPRLVCVVCGECVVSMVLPPARILQSPALLERTPAVQLRALLAWRARTAPRSELLIFLHVHFVRRAPLQRRALPLAHVARRGRIAALVPPPVQIARLGRMAPFSELATHPCVNNVLRVRLVSLQGPIVRLRAFFAGQVDTAEAAAPRLALHGLRERSPILLAPILVPFAPPAARAHTLL